VERLGALTLRAAARAPRGALADLIGPDRLRQWGRQATARTRRASRRVGLARVEQRLDRYHNDLYDRLYDDLSLAYVKGWSPQWLRIQRSLGFDPVADERPRAARVRPRPAARRAAGQGPARARPALDRLVVFLLGFHFDVLAS
jgi:hypothetical protein